MALTRDQEEALLALRRAFYPNRADQGLGIPELLWCPVCHSRHIDQGKFATHEHRDHSCQTCGLTWRPSLLPTVGVSFLPGYKDGDETAQSNVRVDDIRTAIERDEAGRLTSTCLINYKTTPDSSVLTRDVYYQRVFFDARDMAKELLEKLRRYKRDMEAQAADVKGRPEEDVDCVFCANHDGVEPCGH